MQSLKEIEESDVVNDLGQSVEFMRFYAAERDRAGEIEWFFNPDLAKQFMAAEAAHFYDAAKNYKAIHLPRYPVPLEDDHLVAHEIVHAILKEEGQSILVAPRNEQYRELVTYLATLLEDPVVDSFLKVIYHFDLTRDCVRKLPIIMRAWDNQSEPIDRVSQLKVALLLAEQMLKWRLINNREALQNWSDFLSWFADGRPNIYLIAVGFISIIEKHGLDTLDGSYAALQEIVEQYQLEEF